MTYEYVCEACGHLWEAEQSIKDKALKECVSCGKSTAKRLVSGGTGFLLKGGGWYADGYGSPAAAKSSSSEDKPAATGAKTEGKDGKAGDAKPASDAKASDSKASESKTDTASSATPAASTGTPSSAKAS